jgi:hypothetical protein
MLKNVAGTPVTGRCHPVQSVVTFAPLFLFCKRRSSWLVRCVYGSFTVDCFKQNTIPAQMLMTLLLGDGETRRSRKRMPFLIDGHRDISTCHAGHHSCRLGHLPARGSRDCLDYDAADVLSCS